ncbi:Fic family protein [bacterium]|nr:Fic family protein [bacterium]
MAKQAHEILADALDSASTSAVDNILQSRLITEKHLTLLKKAGFLKPILKGWYLLDADLSHSDTGQSVLWHESYWVFIGQYLKQMVGDNYILSPEQSLDLHTGNNVLPNQLLIGNAKKANRIVPLPRGLSLSLYTATEIPKQPDVHDSVNIYPLEMALIKAGPSYFRRQMQEISLALGAANHRLILQQLLKEGHVAAAGRLSGAYRELNMPSAADEVLSVMTAAGFSVKEVNPFDEPVPDFTVLRPQSPHAARIELLWRSLSERITGQLDPAVAPPKNIETTIELLEENYSHDAYHSLSIEGYKVTPELIERVRGGQWNPESDKIDQQNLDAMAARGYWEAHNQVKETIRYLHGSRLSTELLRGDLAHWYRALFGPMVRSGMLEASDLAGYRNRPVFIRGSRHTPLPMEAITDAMDTLFNCIQNEPHPVTRAILGHWLIGYIHPYPDGNGRTARFLMNALLVSAGYPWAVIRLETRKAYMQALEQLSIHQNPDPFVEVVFEAMNHQWE